MSELLSLEGKIDLVIPRGSNALVRSITEQSGGKIPVLGHTEGVCHVFIDQHCDVDKALRIGTYAPTLLTTNSNVSSTSAVLDSKCDYPAACNAMETLLIHSSLLHTPAIHRIISALREHQVSLYLHRQPSQISLLAFHVHILCQC